MSCSAVFYCRDRCIGCQRVGRLRLRSPMPRDVAYLAVNSSNVSSSCPPLLLQHDVLKADLWHVGIDVVEATGAREGIRTAGLNRFFEFDRSASRRAEAMIRLFEPRGSR